MSDTRLRILLIADDAEAALPLQRTLLETPLLDLDLTQADGIEPALALACHRRFDAILLLMPFAPQPELEAIKVIIGAVKQVPLILLCEQAERELASQCLAAGADDCLPLADITAPDIVRAMENAIARHRRQRSCQRDLERRLPGKARYRDLFENSPVSLWELDCSSAKILIDKVAGDSCEQLQARIHESPESVKEIADLIKVKDINRQTLKLFGFASKDRRADVTKVMTEETYAAVLDQLLKLKSGQLEDSGSETESRTMKGDVVHVSFRVSVAPGYEDSWGKVLVSVTDITERKHLMESIRLSNILLRTQQETSLDGMLVIDNGNRIISYNRVFVDMWNVPASALDSGREDEILIEMLDRVLEPEGFLERIEQIKRQPPRESQEYIDFLDGRIIHRYSASMFSDQGQCYGRVWYFRDETERMRNERELIQANEFLDNIINALDDPIFVKDESHRWVVLNDSACKMWGAPRTELIGKSDYDFFPKEQADVFWEKDDLMFRQGGTVANEEQITVNGDIRTIVTKKSVFTDLSSRNSYLVGSIRDISYRKKNEKALEDRLSFESLVSHISTQLINPPVKHIEQVIEAGLASIGHCLSVDRMALDLWGEDRNLSTSFFVWHKNTPAKPDIGKSGKAVLPNLMEEMKAGKPFVFENRDEIPSAWIEERAYIQQVGIKSGIVIPLAVGGVSMGLISASSITESRRWSDSTPAQIQIFGNILANGLYRLRSERALKESQQKYSSILENISVGMVLISADFEILELNKTIREWFPHIASCRHPVCYRSDYGAGGKKMCSCCPTAKCLQDGMIHEAISETRKEDQTYSYRVIASPIRDANGKITAVIELVEDVTEKRRLETQLRHAQKMESIGQLAAGIAHEINTPTQYVGDNIRFLEEACDDLMAFARNCDEILAAGPSGQVPDLAAQLQAALQAADTEYLTEEIPRAITQSKDGVDRIAKIVRAMKEFSHPAHEKTKIDINQAIESTITVARNEWKYVADLETDLDRDLQPIPCLPGELNQTILNIIVNAAHAIGDSLGDGSSDKGRIRVSTRQDGDWAEIRIADSGSGIPENIRARIFDPFFTTKEVGKGTGQGLSIAYNAIVKKHNGELICESEEGQGTEFIIRLPVIEDQPAGEEIQV